MPNRQEIPPMFENSSQKRMEQASATLGTEFIARITALALYLLGAKLKDLAKFVDMPLDTVKSLVKRTLRDGVPALEDRRRRVSTFLPSHVEAAKPTSCTLLVEEETFVVQLDGTRRIELSRLNPVLCRTVLLTLLDAKLLGIEEVSEALGLSRERVRKLRKKLIDGDVHAVLDKRKGQQKDYLFTPEIKSELVQQFAVNAISGQSTSSRTIAEDLQQRCEMKLSERSIRLHLNKLGLTRIANSLAMLVETEKKTS